MNMLEGSALRRACYGIVVAVLLFAFPANDQALASQQRNVVLIVIDALRSDTLHCYGYSRNTSPHIDAFAAESVVFENVFTVAASTGPAMAAIMTGRLPYYTLGTKWDNEVAHGMRRFAGDSQSMGLPFSLQTLAEYFSDSGYATAGFITNPFLKRVYHFEQGFDRYEELFRMDEPYLKYGWAEDVSDGALQWLEGNEKRPFFLFLHYMDVHLPYLPPFEYRSHFEYERVNDKTDEQVNPTWRTETDLSSENIKEHAKGLYDCSMVYADVCIGRVLQYLRERDLMNNSIVVITADHGEEFLEHGGTTHKGTLYDELVHVPLIMRIPGQEPKRIPALVRNFDIMPTLLDYCELGDIEPEMDAISLRPLIEAGATTLGASTFANFPVMSGIRAFPHRRMIRNERYKLILNVEAPEKSELYDLHEDPGERRNVFAIKPDIASMLADSLGGIVAKLETETDLYRPDLNVTVARNASKGFADIEALRDATMIKIPSLADRFILRSTGKDPGMLLPLFPFHENFMPVIRIDLHSPAPTRLQLFYQTTSTPYFTEEQCLTKHLDKGRNTLYLALDAGNVTGRLRIDPGDVPGDYEIYAIEVIDVRRSGAVAPVAPPGQLSVEAHPGDAASGEPPAREPDTSGVDPETLEQLRAFGYIE